MQAQVAAPPADFARQHSDMVEDLRVSEASFTLDGNRHRRPGRGPVPGQAAPCGRWGSGPYQGMLRLVRRDDRWLVDWSPATSTRS